MSARRTLGLCLVSLLSLAGGAASARASTVSLKPPNFKPAPSWVVIRADTEQPYMSSSMVIAVTTPDLKAAQPFAAFTSLKRLSSRGILVWAMTIGRSRPTFTPMHWPPRLASFRLDHAWEGQPAANVQQRLKWGVVNGWDMDIRVYLATQHPDKKLLAEAQAQLDRIVLPSISTPSSPATAASSAPTTAGPANAAPQASHALAVRPPHFGTLPPGWGQFSGPVEPLTRHGANASAVATSWDYRPNPVGWGDSIPRNGVAVQVLLIRRQVGRPTGLNLCHVTPHLTAYPFVRNLPLRLPRTTSATFEGSPEIPEYRVFGRIGESYNFEVRVDINTPHPPAAMLNTAQHAVAAIDFPRWPNPLHC